MHVSILLPTLALSLPWATSARTLGKKSIAWNSCPELNKNISEVTATVGPFQPFECGSLLVPLDHTDDDSPGLSLDLFRIKATKEPVLGSVLFNPGGPGGQAGDSFPPGASDLRANIGEQYHIVSWDPRGTGYTIPYNCSGAPEGTALPGQKRDLERVASANLTNYFLTAGWEEAGQIAEVCAASMNETGPLIGTTFTARDMLAIVDALGEDGMLRYYGISYGTVLGHYFAAMFPDRVERMVLDSNLDPEAYRNGTWANSLLDTEKTYKAFLDSCFENKDECALVSFINANSSQDLFDGLNLVIEPLAEAVNANSSDQLSFLAYAGLKGSILPELYYPSRWPALAESLVAQLNATTTSDDSASEGNSTETEETPWTYGAAVEAIQGIWGADTIYHPISAEEYLPTVEHQASLSGFSDIWYLRAWSSARWLMPATEQFHGEFKAITKHPILYVNGEFDPVTPLYSAHTASRGFEGSVVLAHSGKGHTILADPSRCVQNYVQAYFKEGTLPEEGAHCEPDLGPWDLAKARGGMALGAIEV